MKIAFIVSKFPTLSEIFILNQITGLLDLGHDIEIFALRNSKEEKMHPDVKKYGLMERVYYLNEMIPQNKILRVFKAIYLISRNFYKSPLKILRSLNVFKYRKKALSLWLLYLIIPFLNKDFDIIHCHFGHIGNIGVYLKRLGFEGKFVTMFHGYGIRLGIEKGGGIYQQLFEFGDCFLAISDYNYENLVRFGLNPRKIIFHPVGIDINKFPFRWQSIPVERSSTVIIITIARLVEAKGIQYGIQAISKLLKEYPTLHLEYRIIGGGRFKERLRKIVEELGLGGVVRFLGPLGQEEVIREIQKAHVFLLPSVAEALPLVLMEAQAVGLPIVATNVGSTSQVIIDGESGFLVPERDVDSLAEKIKYLIERPEIWPGLGRAGRKYVEENYDIEKLNNRLVEIYERLIGENE